MIITHNNQIITNNNVIADYPITQSQTTLRILVLGDATAPTVGTNISTEMVSLGYSAPTVTTQVISTTYTGSDISVSSHDVIVYWTNSSQTGAAALSTNLRNYVNNGGNLVTGTFIWNIRPSGFDFTLTPYAGPVNQSNNANGNMTITVAHPITNNLNTAITSNNTALNNLVTTLNSGATTIATYTLGGTPYVGVNTVGTARLVGLNIYFPLVISSRPNTRRLLVNSILWAGKIIN